MLIHSYAINKRCTLMTICTHLTCCCTMNGTGPELESGYKEALEELSMGTFDHRAPRAYHSAFASMAAADEGVYGMQPPLGAVVTGCSMPSSSWDTASGGRLQGTRGAPAIVSILVLVHA
jgi:hypothetical protein